MPRVWCAAAIVVVSLAAATSLRGQDQAERVVVAFSDPSRPGTLNVQLLDGALTIRGTNRRDVAIEARGGRQVQRPADPSAGGLRRLQQRGTFAVDEQANTMRISTPRPDRAMEFIVEVPTRTNLKLGMVNGGALLVENVEGDIETSNVNGPSTTLTNVSGSVVANATNGKVVAVLARVTAQKAMAFTSLNGVVDVTLPASVRANVKLRSDQGDVFTDFDIQLTASKEQPVGRDSRQSGGRYRLDIDRSLYGTINGGGPEFELRSFNGNVYLRRSK
jgi:hypothetical protein